jgi:ubiquinone biosynthesis protein UbiJ
MMEDIIAIIMIFGGMTAIGLGFSPIGRALAERIRGKAGMPGAEELRAELGEQQEMVMEEVRQVRREVAELAERVDFAERVLAQQREAPRLAPGSER